MALAGSSPVIDRLLEASRHARIVLLAEAFHARDDELRLRNALFEALVSELGFRAIAIESGLIEGRVVHEYVKSGQGQLDEVVAEGLTWGFDACPANSDLVEWMREHNAHETASPINFYGFDLSGMLSARQPFFAYAGLVERVQAILARVDLPGSHRLSERLSELVPVVFDARRRIGPRYYADLEPAERDWLTAVIADAQAWMDRLEPDCTARMSSEDYGWARRTVHALQQLDGWMRSLPIGWRPDSDPNAPLVYTDFLAQGSDLRDRGMADNLDWILDREGPDCRLLVYASRFHLSTAPAQAARWGVDAQAFIQRPAGSYIRRRHGQSLLAIGHLFAGKDSLGTALDTRLAEADCAPFLIEVNAEAAAGWATEPQRVGGDLHSLEFRPCDAFDYFIHLGRVETAA